MVHVRMDGGPHFREPLQDLLKQSNIPFTPSSPYNPSSNILGEYYIQTRKQLLKEYMKSDNDIRTTSCS